MGADLKKSLLLKHTKEEIQEILNSSNSFLEALKKIGYKQGGSNVNTLKKYCDYYNIDYSKLKEERKRLHSAPRTDEEVFNENSIVSQETVRKRYFKKKITPYKCAICGITNWNGKQLVLRLDHINGKNHDNRIENLRWVCHNCDSQLPTYCGKKEPNFCKQCGIQIPRSYVYCEKCRKNIVKIPLEKSKVAPPKDVLLKEILKEKNLEKVGAKYGVSGGSVKKWCKAYKLINKNQKIRDFIDQKENIDRKVIEKYNSGLSLNKIKKDLDISIEKIKKILNLNKELLTRDLYISSPKSVIQKDLKGREIKRFESLTAAEKYLGIDKSYKHISEVCNKKRKTAYGYIWEFANT